MGIPYSRQIHAAFDQVTPLVAAGFEVLQTTKNISILLAAIQVLTVIFLALIFVELFALLVTINPELEYERQNLVTPVVKWFAGLFIQLSEYRKILVFLALVILVGVCIGSAAGLYYTSKDPTLVIDDLTASTEESGLSGEDIEAIKKGEAKQ
ncbi:hypothetical protein LTR64_007043 [Lithohypha guttulata]|uniref:uncharacterized protein n=1 Tax=Lithohypha guttulata TaxID=1690604 RepID=UPI002DDF14EA|nr:hypothetical protein LTR51_004400 [Lithohypha guttulata]